MTQPLIAFVIPVFNGAATLASCLESVLSQKSQIPFEVIVVNNNSTDGSELIASRYPIRVVNETEQGRSQARNRGWKSTTSDWVAFVDCDVVLQPNWLEEMHRTIVLNNHTAGQGRIIPASKENSFFALYREHVLSIQTQGSYCHLDAEHFFYPMINTAACLFRKSELATIGGFDVAFESHEDVDLSWRLWMRGATFSSVMSAESHVYWPQGGYWRYLLRSWRMGKSLGLLYSLWEINILQSVQLPSIHVWIPFQIMMAFQNFVFSTAYWRCWQQSRGISRRGDRLLQRNSPVRFTMGNGDVILVNSEVRHTWTSKSLILKDCAKHRKINLARNSHGVSAEDYFKILETHRDQLVQLGLIRIFKSTATI